MSHDLGVLSCEPLASCSHRRTSQKQSQIHLGSTYADGFGVRGMAAVNKCERTFSRDACRGCCAGAGPTPSLRLREVCLEWEPFTWNGIFQDLKPPKKSRTQNGSTTGAGSSSRQTC
eukprot:6480914-Amphidinium_carterae.1